MANFLLIQNPVKSVPDVELITTLGLSGSRGDDSRIGMFGTGGLNALALLARTPHPDQDCTLLERTKFCMGKNVFTFGINLKMARTANGVSKDASTIYMKQQNGATYDLNISINFGENDWTHTGLAIREIVSNAIDGVIEYGGTPSKDVIITTDTPDQPRATRAADGYMRWYIPINDDIRVYVDNIHKFFRCLAPGYSSERTILINTDNEGVLYRKGVAVRRLGKSLFHYNINDIPINESRQVDSWTAREECAKAIASSGDASIIAKYLTAKITGGLDGYFEKDLYVNYMKPDSLNVSGAKLDEVKRAFKDAISRVIGNKVVCDNTIAARMVQSKGLEAITLDSDTVRMLVEYGVKRPDDVLNRHEVEGKEIIDPTPAAQAMLDFVWTALERTRMTLSKDKPSIRCFVQHITDGGMLGYYRPGDGCVYIRRDTADGITTDGLDTILHEVAHYLTGASDLTHEFNQFAYKCAASLLMERLTTSSEVRESEDTPVLESATYHGDFIGDWF